MRRLLTISAVVFLATALHARETAVLRNGFAISHDHHELHGATTRLFLSASDQEYVDVETESIVNFEKEEPLHAGDPVCCVPAAAQVAPVPLFTGPSSPELNRIVEKAARDNQLDSDFVHAVIRAESRGNANAVSRKGAQGLMQLMPQTAASLGVKNSFDPTENVSAGAKHLRELLARYNNDPARALAAYNAGAGRVQQYHGVPPYRETRAYVATIIHDFNRRKLEQRRSARLSKKVTQAASRNHLPDGN